MIINVYQNNQKLESSNLSDLVSSDFVENFTFLIGRSNECRIVLPDKKVSRNHCEIKYANRKWRLRKISNFSEVIFNGKNIDEIELRANSFVEIGPYKLEFEFLDDSSVLVQDSINNTISSQEEDSIKPQASPVSSSSIPSDEDLGYPELEADHMDETQLEDDTYVTEEEFTEEVSAENDTENIDSDYINNDEYDDEVSFNDVDTAEQTEGDEEYEQSFNEGNYDIEESVGEKTQVFSGFADYDLEIFGEYAPYDRYSIDEGDVIIGRDETSADIFLNDSEVSSKHAKLTKTKVSLRLVDMNSANGTLLNGSRINESELQSGDEFIIGSTTFTVHIRSDMIQSEKGRLLPVEENQIVEIEEVVEVEGEASDEINIEEEAPKSLVGKFRKLPPRKQKIYGAIAILLLFLLLDSEDPQEKKIVSKKPKSSKEEVSGDAVKKAVADSMAKLTLQEREVVASKYQLAFEFIQQGKYSESLSELDYVMKLAPDYKQARSLYQMSREGLAKLEELEKKRLADIEAKRRQEKIEILLEKAQKYVKERQAQAAEGIFTKILELDPENFDVPQLKLEIDAWKKEQERLAMEKAQKDADRKRKIGQISPSRTFFGKEEWYKAILKVEEFLRIKDMDEDLVKEATNILKESKNNLKGKIDPMIGKARSLKEGQDLKAAYEQYLDVLKHEPTNVEALDEMNEIRDVLTLRSQKVYRDGLISESLMLYKEAKEKFQEVQQISPSDSDYYKKASLKLREYLE